MPDCNHNCGECSKECGERANPTSFQEKPNAGSKIKKVIAVVSGKGGVGKSLVTSLLAVNARRMGKKVAVIDADVTGPSIPTAFGLIEKCLGDGNAIYPVVSKTGIECMSLNLLIDDPTEPVVWRGPVVSGMIKQFWTEVAYGEIDELYVDMPPGTADVPLTVFQTLPIDGIVVVTTPQDLVSLIVEKALKMAKMMDIKVLGIVENMSYIECPHCGERVYPYGQSDKKIEEKYGLKLLGSLPIDGKLAQKVDEGNIEFYEGNYLLEVNKTIEEL